MGGQLVVESRVAGKRVDAGGVRARRKIERMLKLENEARRLETA